MKTPTIKDCVKLRPDFKIVKDRSSFLALRASWSHGGARFELHASIDRRARLIEACHQKMLQQEAALQAKKKKKKPVTYPELLPLMPDELQLLIECPFRKPGIINGAEKRVAQRLMQWGLLECDPNRLGGDPLTVRCTEAGEEQAAPLSHARVKYERDRIEEAWLAEHEHSGKAYRLERTLWMRLLVESALGGSRTASIALETCEFVLNA